MEDIFYTKSKLINTLNLNKSVLNRIINYLNIIPNDKLYSENDLNKIKEFLKENPNTRTFFQKQTYLNKYGVENPQQLKIIQEKKKKTMLEKYGVENPSQSEKIKQKKIETLKSHFGVNMTNPMDSDVIRRKVVNNWKNKTDEEKKSFLNNYKQAMINKYNVDNPLKINSIKEKSIISRKLNKNKEKIEFENLNGKVWSIEELCLKFSKCKDKMYDVIKLFDIEIITLKDNLYIKDSDIHFLQDYFDKSKSQSISNEEKELLKFIKSIYFDEIIENDKSVINPYELDIYLPKRNIAFEFDGLYWHSSLYKDKYYHFNKTKKCEEKGIRLIHIFEDDWIYNIDIVKSMIKSSLGIYERKIFARKCIVKEIDVKSYRKFMNENHLQGFTKATHYVGLFYNDELVQSVGMNFNGLNKIWELNRMATLLNTQIIGGFSKLVKYSVNKYKIKELNSYVFKAWFNGKGYTSIGFKFDYECQPTWWYIVNGKKVNRMNYQKKFIERKFNDGKLKYFNKDESEFKNMANNGINWIWDCGKIRMKYKI